MSHKTKQPTNHPLCHTSREVSLFMASYADSTIIEGADFIDHYGVYVLNSLIIKEVFYCILYLHVYNRKYSCIVVIFTSCFLMPSTITLFVHLISFLSSNN